MSPSAAAVAQVKSFTVKASDRPTAKLCKKVLRFIVKLSFVLKGSSIQAITQSDTLTMQKSPAMSPTTFEHRLLSQATRTVLLAIHR